MKTQVTVKTSDGLKASKVIFSQFPDGDTYCRLQHSRSIEGNDVIISHDLYPNQNDKIFQLLLMVDLLNDLGAKSISLFVPYLPYSRQDKRHLAGEAISASTLSKTLKQAGVRTLYTCDCHFMKGDPITNYNGLEIRNVTLGTELINYFNKKFGNDKYDIVSPDQGSNYIVSTYGGQSMHKERGSYDKDGATVHRSIRRLNHDHLKLSHKRVLLIDDMISTGGTMLSAVEKLKKNGADIYCLATHGLFINGCYELLVDQAKGLFVSDTLQNKSSIPLVQKAWKEDIIPSWIARCHERLPNKK